YSNPSGRSMKMPEAVEGSSGEVDASAAQPANSMTTTKASQRITASPVGAHGGTLPVLELVGYLPASEPERREGHAGEGNEYGAPDRAKGDEHLLCLGWLGGRCDSGYGPQEAGDGGG